MLNGQPLYNVNISFWDNLRLGPRELTESEKQRINELNMAIETLKKEHGIDLSFNFFDKRIESPVGLCAGPAYGSKWLSLYAKLGYDILTQKTVRDRLWKGHPLPNIVCIEGDWKSEFKLVDKFTGSITNSFGIGSLPPEEWSRDLTNFIRNLDQLKTLKISTVCTTSKGETQESIIEQFVNLSRIVKQTGSHGVEFDLSCPNIAPSESSSEGDIYTDDKLTRKITEAVRDEVGTKFPIFLKVGYLKDYTSLVEVVSGLADAIVAVNAMPAPVNDKNGRSVFEDRGGKAGVCGLAVLGMGLDAVTQLVKLRERFDDFKIIGIGGILNPETAMKYLDLGADAIEIGTGAIYNPFLALEIKKALLERKLND